MTVNTCTFTGNLGQDSEFKVTQGGKELLVFSIAVSAGWGENKSSFWVRCTKWGKGAEKLAMYLKKGTNVTVSGELNNRQYDKDGQQKTSLELTVVQVAWSKHEPSVNAAHDSQQKQGGWANQQQPQEDSNWDDDIPF